MTTGGVATRIRCKLVDLAQVILPEGIRCDVILEMMSFVWNKNMSCSVCCGVGCKCQILGSSIAFAK